MNKLKKIAVVLFCAFSVFSGANGFAFAKTQDVTTLQQTISVANSECNHETQPQNCEDAKTSIVDFCCCGAFGVCGTAACRAENIVADKKIKFQTSLYCYNFILNIYHPPKNNFRNI
ncbi:hypothetical protein [Endomicrobium proavitum]|uniref:hypothetical protein n=1 Tax=Endomicrobium proavitum TaxID=1408281 RepID=UPI0006973A6F|nr:hypothetical protein [Endomicrobium proavitum]